MTQTIYFIWFSFTPFTCYICMAATAFSVPCSSAWTYFFLIICCARRYEWGPWPEDFYRSCPGLTAFGNLRCCTNSGNTIWGISCHLINVRRLSIPSMIYGWGNTESFVKYQGASPPPQMGCFENKANWNTEILEEFSQDFEVLALALNSLLT